MADPYSAALGQHGLPARFSGPAPRQAPPRRHRRTGLILGIAGVLVAAGVGTALQLSANLGYDDASERFTAQHDDTTADLAAAGASITALQTVSDAASQIIQADDGSLVDVASKDALSAAVGDATTAIADAEALVDTVLPDRGEKPAWFWELFAASDRLSADRTVMAALDDELADEELVIGTAKESVADTGAAVLSTAASAAASFEAAHISAKNDAVIALRETAADLAEADDALDQDAVDAFVALQGAAAVVVSSEQEELAEKAGPLLSDRLAVEAFARSLAPNVLLEFDWNPIVNGVGFNGSMGGYTTWWWSPPGRAVIELSDSVAEQWPDIRSKSLVAHEIGHAISVKCQGMYDPSTQDSIEKWATAWAISMGYTDDANGVWAYGYPPQSYIDAAGGCR